MKSIISGLVAMLIGLTVGWLLWHNDISYYRMAEVRNFSYAWGYGDCRDGQPMRFTEGMK